MMEAQMAFCCTGPAVHATSFNVSTLRVIMAFVVRRPKMICYEHAPTMPGPLDSLSLLTQTGSLARHLTARKSTELSSSVGASCHIGRDNYCPDKPIG